MPLKISQHDIVRMKDQVEKMKKRTANVVEKSHEMVGTIVRTAEVGAAAFSMGLIQGKYGGVEIVGVPMDLGLGIGLHMLGLLGVGGDMSGHLHAFGDGSLAAYLSALGAKTGYSWKRKALSGGETKLIETGEQEVARKTAASGGVKYWYRDAYGNFIKDAAGNPIEVIPGVPPPAGAAATAKGAEKYKMKGERLPDEELERLARGQ